MIAEGNAKWLQRVDNESGNEGDERWVDLLNYQNTNQVEYYTLYELLQSTGTHNLLIYITGKRREIVID